MDEIARHIQRRMKEAKKHPVFPAQSLKDTLAEMRSTRDLEETPMARGPLLGPVEQN